MAGACNDHFLNLRGEAAKCYLQPGGREPRWGPADATETKPDMSKKGKRHRTRGSRHTCDEIHPEAEHGDGSEHRLWVRLGSESHSPA